MQRCAVVLLFSLFAAPLALPQTVVGTITRAGLEPHAVAVYEAGNRVFVADQTTGNVYTFDGATHAELASAAVGTFVRDMAVHEGSGKLYVESDGVGKVAVLNAGTGAFIKYLDGSFGNFSTFVVDEPLGKVWIISGIGGLNRIDVATDTIANVPGVGTGSYDRIALHPVTHELFVSEYGGTLKIVNPDTLAVTNTGVNGSLGLGLNWTENKAYIATGTAGSTSFRIYDRDDGSTGSLVDVNDGTRFVFDPVRNRVITSAEVNDYSTIIRADNSYTNFPLRANSVTMARRDSTGHVYHAGRSHVTMFDEATHVVERIAVDNPAQGGVVLSDIAINQTTGRVYVIHDAGLLPYVNVIQDTPALARPPIYVGTQGNGFFPRTHMVDPVTMGTVFSFSASQSVYGVAFGIKPGGESLYAPSYTSTFYPEVAVLTGNGNKARTTIAPGGDDPAGIAVAPDGTRLYVASSGASPGLLNVLNTATSSTVTDVTVGTTPWGVAITPDGTKVFVTNKGSNNVSVVATATNTVAATVAVGSQPYGVAVHPAGRKAYVANSASGTVSILDVASNTVTGTIAVGTAPHWLAFTPDGKTLWVTNSGGGSVTVIDTGTDSVVTTVTTGSTPKGITAHPDNSRMFVVKSVAGGPSGIAAIDTATYAVTSHALPAESQQALAIAMADPTGRIGGRITSSSGGAVIAGATVRALQSGVQKAVTTTNAAGDYALPNLLPGTYDVEISKTGFTTNTTSGLTALHGRVTAHSIALSALPCDFELTPTYASHSAAGGSGTIQVVVQSYCQWNASAPGGSFVTVTGGSSGTGNGTVSYSVAQNAGSTARLDAITIGTATATIAQNGSGTSLALTATGAAAQADLAWNAVAGATSYSVTRRSGGGAFATIATTGSTALTDSAVAAGTAYLYRVIANGASGTLAYSNVDLAFVFGFTDVLTPASTPVRAVHLTELRTGMNAARAALGWQPAAFTDVSLSGAVIRRVHVVELRTVLDAVRAAAGLAPMSYSTPAIAAGATTVKAADVNELRQGLR